MSEFSDSSFVPSEIGRADVDDRVSPTQGISHGGQKVPPTLLGLRSCLYGGQGRYLRAVCLLSKNTRASLPSQKNMPNIMIFPPDPLYSASKAGWIHGLVGLSPNSTSSINAK
ncbi:hypothetical protein TNCV_1065881 [Trichonephila clavipes]|nr:hypothetical protein TNCV_1065881 [Trichonephila clavipes]